MPVPGRRTARTARTASTRRPAARRPPAVHADRVDGRRRGPASAVVRTPKNPNYTAVFVEELDRAGEDRRADRRDHGRHADRDGPVEVPGGVPRPVHRRRDRRAALGRARDRPRDGWDAAGGRPLLDVPPARLRPDRPRRLPERPAGADRGRPGRARRRGRHEPPGDVHAAGAAPAAEPRDREPQGRAGAPLAAA